MINEVESNDEGASHGLTGLLSHHRNQLMDQVGARAGIRTSYLPSPELDSCLYRELRSLVQKTENTA
jgi:hypothetical protein